MKSTVSTRIAKLRASIGSTSRKTSFAQALDAGLSLRSARTLRNLQPKTGTTKK